MRAPQEECRKHSRIRVQIPIFVRGTDADGDEFVDLTKTLDFSAAGAFLVSPRLLGTNQIVKLTIPAPSAPSSVVPGETTPIQARVRRRRKMGEVYLFGLEFMKVLD